MTIATTENNTLSLVEEQSWWTDRQIAGLRQVGIDQATDGDLLVFFHVCQRTGLDPFARQIHMVSRNAKDENDRWIKKWTIQTGIDGFRLIADRADRRDGTLREYEDAVWFDAEGNHYEVWTKATAPSAAKVVVLRNGKRFPATVMYSEYVQTKRNGDPNSMWSRMPANQLAKCAEAAALRKAYPQDLSGVYTDDEMGQADSHRVEQVPTSGLGAVLSQTSVAGGGRESDSQDADDPQVRPSATESPLLNTSSKLAKAMYAAIRDAGITKEETPGLYQQITGRQVESSKELTDDEARAVLAHLDAIKPAPICPECQQGKHQNCSGQAWDNAADEPVDCGCTHEATS